MHASLCTVLAIVTVIVTQQAVSAAPQAVLEPQRLVVTTPGYRVTFHRWQCDLQLDLRDDRGHWRSITKRNTRPEFAVVDALSAATTKIERLLNTAKKLAAGFQPIAPEPEEQWSRPVPDFPEALRRARPVEDIRQAVVYTINETILSDDCLDLARKAGSDVLIRAWFKWGTAPDFAKLAPLVPKAHELEAYSVAILQYDHLPEVTLSGRRMVPSWQWARPARNEFAVQKGGLVRQQWALPGMLQGKLHQHLRNPPTFVVNMPKGGSLAVHVRGVATLGAKLQWQVDSRVEKVFDLPDRDGKNDAMAREYDRTFEFSIPPGRHRVTLDNVGGDWACIGWYAVTGETLDP